MTTINEALQDTMILVKTSDLTDIALNWAVAKCAGIKFKCVPTHTASEYERGIRSYSIHFNQYWNEDGQERWKTYSPSTIWSQAGPIIDFLIEDGYSISKADYGLGIKFFRLLREIFEVSYGPTTLIAAMRRYVASKMGDEVNIPEKLIG